MNFGTPVPLLIGIILILGALALFFLDKFRPGYERDSDKVYAVLLLISGLFLLAHLDMELLASFQQLLMAGMLTTLLIESVRTRLPKSDPLRPTEPMMDRRPPGPRYDERPPVRRGYRAELDDRANFRPEFRDRPAQPRMNPAPREAYPQQSYAAGQVRPPYEEYRGPAGRLQPSGGPPDNRYSDNSRYGERPPAPNRVAERPPERRPERPPAQSVDAFRPPNGSANGQDRFAQGRPPQDRSVQGFSSAPAEAPRPRQERDSTESASYGQSNFDQPELGDRTLTRPERPPTDESYPNNSRRNSSENSRENSVENSGSSAKALNIRPLSEAPDFDGDYSANN